MFESGWSLPLWQALERMSDQELIGMLKYIRGENGERVNLFQLRRYLREKRKEHEDEQIKTYL